MFYEDLIAGRKFSTESHLLLEDEVTRFAELTGDKNRLHMDREYAMKTLFKGKVAHGMLVLSLSFGLWFESGVTRDSMIALLGIDELAFKAAVRPGERIRLMSEVRSRRSSKSNPNAGVVKFRDRVTRDDGSVALEFTRVLLVRKRPGAGPR